MARPNTTEGKTLWGPGGPSEDDLMSRLTNGKLPKVMQDPDSDDDLSPEDLEKKVFLTLFDDNLKNN